MLTSLLSRSTMTFIPVLVGVAFFYLYLCYHKHMELMEQLDQSQTTARLFHTTLSNLIQHYQLQEDLGIPEPVNEKAFCFRLRNIGGGR